MIRPQPSDKKETLIDDKEHAQGAKFRKEHDELANGLVKMAQILKRNNLAIQEMIRKDQTVLDSAELVMTTNVSRFKRENDQLGAFKSTSWKSTWRLFLMLFWVAFALLFMYFFIKLTSRQ